ncbi:MAG: hypothetical protein Q4C70_12245 [Planctomycetia bacterium]|nr:hypothetical protein [Planctomycetia bacterium]
MKINYQGMIKTVWVACIAALGSIWAWGDSENSTNSGKNVPASALPLWLECVPEMDPIPLLDEWKSRVELNPELKKKFQKIWVDDFGIVRDFLTPERVQEMSRWSRTEMERYRYVTLQNPEKTDWKTVGHDENATQFLRSAFLESLPAEHGMNRRLVAYALFDTRTGNINSVVFTIRSELIHEEKRSWFLF